MKTKLFLLLIAMIATLRGAEVYVFTTAGQFDAVYIAYTGKVAATGVLIYGDDGRTAAPSWSGKIVLVDRGGTAILDKLNVIRNAGGIGMILANNTDGAAPAVSIGIANSTTYPAVTVSKADGLILRSKQSETVTIASIRPPAPVTPTTGLKVSIKTDSYQLAVDDNNSIIGINSANPTNWTIPDDSVLLPTGATIKGVMLGVGPVSVVGAPNVTLVAIINGLKAKYTGTTWLATKLGPNLWLVEGRLISDGSASPPDSVKVGSKILLSVDYAGGHPGVTFQWYKDGTPISGQTGPAIIIQEMQAVDAGTYKATVSNEAGSAEGTAAILVATPGP